MIENEHPTYYELSAINETIARMGGVVLAADEIPDDWVCIAEEEDLREFDESSPHFQNHGEFLADYGHQNWGIVLQPMQSIGQDFDQTVDVYAKLPDETINVESLFMHDKPNAVSFEMTHVRHTSNGSTIGLVKK